MQKRAKKIKSMPIKEADETILLIDKEIFALNCPVHRATLKHFNTNRLLIPKTNNIDDLMIL